MKAKPDEPKSKDKELRDIGERTKAFALSVVRLYAGLPKTTVAQVMGRQLLRSGTSVGAHWREARRSRSNAEFVSKVEAGLQELDEARYWLELLDESGAAKSERYGVLKTEADELAAILVTCARNAKEHRK
jgi:four helix bundle protein